MAEVKWATSKSTFAGEEQQSAVRGPALCALALLVFASACGGESADAEDPFIEKLTVASAVKTSAGRDARAQEVTERIVRWHAEAGHRIVATVTEKNGDVVDLVAAESVPGSQVKGPPEPTLIYPPGTEEPEDPDFIGAGDPNIVRYVRPKFAGYVEGGHSAESIDEYIRNAEVGGPPAPGLVPGTPCTTNCQRLYAASRQTVSNKGVSAYVNANWSPGTVASSDTFFLAQINAIDLNTNVATNAEWVGLIIGRNPQLSDTNARIFSEYYTAGTNNVGPYIGGWSGAGFPAGFVPRAGSPVSLFDQVDTISTVGGSQYSKKLTVEWFPTSTDPCGTGCTGSWWLGYGTKWFGYYPVGASTPNINFDRITNSAPTVDWYGEVWDGSPTLWTATDMASNQYAVSGSGNFNNVGYFRLLSYKRASDSAWLSSSTAQVQDAGGDDPDCYTRSEQALTAGWETTMWFGGPGATTTNGCDPF